MKFVLFICLVFWWLMAVYNAVDFQIKYARTELGEDNPGFSEFTDFLGPRGARLLYTFIFFLSISADNILLIVALALSKYANNPEVFHHYLITLLMLNIVFDLMVSPAILKLDMDHKASTKIKILFGLTNLIIIIFGAITIFTAF